MRRVSFVILVIILLAGTAVVWARDIDVSDGGAAYPVPSSTVWPTPVPATAATIVPYPAPAEPTAKPPKPTPVTAIGEPEFPPPVPAQGGNNAP